MNQVLKEKMELIFKKYRHCKMFESDKESKNYVKQIDKVVNNLPFQESELIYERYMVKDSDYITNRNVSEFKLTDPVSAPQFIRVRTRAFEAIAAMLNLTPGESND